jgi:hypothetical protein
VNRLTKPFSQRTYPAPVAAGAMTVALVLGLLGFLAHFFWILAVVVLALGVGYAFAVADRKA